MAKYCYLQFIVCSHKMCWTVEKAISTQTVNKNNFCSDQISILMIFRTWASLILYSMIHSKIMIRTGNALHNLMRICSPTVINCNTVLMKISKSQNLPKDVHHDHEVEFSGEVVTELTVNAVLQSMNVQSNV